MAINFPTSLDDLTPVSDGSVASPTEWNDLQDAIEALEVKVGIDDSTIATSHDYLVSRKLAARQDADGDSDSYFEQSDRYRVNPAGVYFFCITTSYVYFYKDIVPMAANVWDWGASSYKWNDMRLNGTLYLDGAVIGATNEINHLRSNLDYISLGLRSGNTSMRFRHSRLYIRGTVSSWDYDLYDVHNGGSCAEGDFNNGSYYFAIEDGDLGHDCDVVFATKLTHGDDSNFDVYTYIGEADSNDLRIYTYDSNGSALSLVNLGYHFSGFANRYCYVDIWYGTWQ